MRKLVTFLFIAIAFGSCKKAKEDAKQLFDISFQSSTKNQFTLPKIADNEYPLPDSVLKIKTADITNTIPEEFKKNNADIEKVKSVRLESVQLEIKSPSTQHFGFMKSIKIYLGANGIGETLVATKDNIHTIVPPPTTLKLDAQDADILRYIKNPTYYLRTETVLAKTYTQDIVIESTLTFKAVANPLN